MLATVIGCPPNSFFPKVIARRPSTYLKWRGLHARRTPRHIPPNVEILCGIINLSMWMRVIRDLKMACLVCLEDGVENSAKVGLFDDGVEERLGFAAPSNLGIVALKYCISSLNIRRPLACWILAPSVVMQRS